MALEPGLSTKTVIRSDVLREPLGRPRRSVCVLALQQPAGAGVICRFHERAALLIITVCALTEDK